MAMLACSLLVLSAVATVPSTTIAGGVTPEEALLLRDEHAFPLDELRPLSCQGEDSLGGYALTLIDSLDTLALLGDYDRFSAAIQWVGENIRFDIDKTVSVFESNIRILGGLLSAHLIASDYSTGMKVESYDDQLLHLAVDLAQRMLPAFDTPTGIPFGSINLLYGVDENESKITSTAGGGTLTLEFGILSRLTNNSVLEEVTKNAVRGIWARRSQLNLVGAHINVFTGEWTQKDAGIGTSIDSFYEYLLKAYLLFGDDEYLFMFQEAYKAAMRYLFHDPWYVEVNMNSAATVWPLFNSLQAFWPGLQVLAGDVDPASRTHAAFLSVWRKYGFTPEGFNLATYTVQNGQRSYPLRPELIESTYWLYKATRDSRYLDAGREFVASLQYGARCPCGYCHISDVETHKQDDHMESFFLAETVKYLWLLFDLAVGPDNIVENGPYKYIFSTEGHLFPVTPEIALVSENCTYFGVYCRDRRPKFGIREHPNYEEINSTRSRDPFRPMDSFVASGFIKGLCPGLTHAQKLGIAYEEEEKVHDHVATTQQNEHLDLSDVQALSIHSTYIVTLDSLSSQTDVSSDSVSSSATHNDSVELLSSTTSNSSGYVFDDDMKGSEALTESKEVSVLDSDDGQQTDEEIQSYNDTS